MWGGLTVERGERRSSVRGVALTWAHGFVNAAPPATPEGTSTSCLTLTQRQRAKYWCGENGRYSIGEFSQRSGLTARALRLYDDSGLPAPDFVDEATGYRYYAPRQYPCRGHARQARRRSRSRKASDRVPKMAQAVDQLERMGYVKRRPNPHDRRSRLVFLTQHGASVKPVTHAAAARVEERWAELTSPRELEALRTALLRLLTELRAP